MAKISILSFDGKVLEDIELKEEVFNREPDEYLISEVIRQILADKRSGTASTKTRAEVRGGGAKPWRQKGTGRARAGSNRSPLWIGGGRTHGPKPRDFSYTLPKKQKKRALFSALSGKFRAGNLVIIDKMEFDKPGTKDFISFLNRVCPESSALIFMVKAEESYKNANLSCGNIPYVKLLAIDSLNVYDIMNFDKMILTRKSIERLQEVYA